MGAREDLMAAAIQAAHTNPLSERELALSIRPESPLLRLLGTLLMNNQENAGFMASADLITEEGRMEAIRRQGMLLGRVQQVEGILDLIIEGQENVETE